MQCIKLNVLKKLTLRQPQFLKHISTNYCIFSCLRFGHWLTLCTLNIHILTYLLTEYEEMHQKADLHDVLNESTFERLTTLDKPHCNDMICQRHGVMAVSITRISFTAIVYNIKTIK